LFRWRVAGHGIRLHERRLSGRFICPEGALGRLDAVILDGKVALVTGGTRGIGLAVSERFAREGAHVVMASVDSSEQRTVARDCVEEASAPGRVVRALRCDVGVPHEIELMISMVRDEFGRIDILVNNAGIAGYGDLFETSLDELQRIYDVNYRGALLCSLGAARIMIEARCPGRIIMTSSLGALTGSEVQAQYCATKAALHNLTMSLAMLLGRHNITCNAVAPALILTDMSEHELADPDRQAALLQRTPVGRIGDPRDLATAYLYFASPESGFTTGTYLRIDGGVLLRV
jgi:NAD(P)-dependent dehydrogenase (short-subunit alcohol dehydrogenase family)